MKLRDFLNQLEKELSSIYDAREASNIVKTLRMDHPVICSMQLDDEDGDKLFEQVREQLFAHVPIQYITELAHFYGYTFFVNNSVLIPRPETEELVYTIINYLKTAPNKNNILDIGTGSGCIPISLKKQIKDLVISAIDVSEKAINVAKKNAAKMETAVKFEQVDFLNESTWQNLEVYDIIVSNPPYIGLDEKENMGKSTLLHEPELALFPENDPLIFYRKINDFAADHLAVNGAIFMEINEYYSEETEKIFSKTFQTNILNDLQGKPRILVCSR